MKKALKLILQRILNCLENKASDINGTLKSYNKNVNKMQSSNDKLKATKSELEATIVTLEKDFENADEEDKAFVTAELVEFRDFLVEINEVIEANTKQKLKTERASRKIGFLQETYGIRAKIESCDLTKSRVKAPDFESDIERLRK
jgi:chromosome segregation ATPase